MSSRGACSAPGAGDIAIGHGVVLLLLKNVAFTVVVPGTVAVYLPWLIARDLAAASLAYGLISLLLGTLGATIYLWCLWDFAVFGRGTPAPIDAPKKLVVRGPYRYARNPMYLGVLTVILAWLVLFPTRSLLLYAVAVAAAFHLVVVLYEEPHLRRTFGAEYESYCAQVGRWLPVMSSRSGSRRRQDR